MSTYVKNLSHRYLLGTAAVFIFAGVAIAEVWYSQQSALDQAGSRSSTSTGFEVPPTKGATPICSADYPYYPTLGQMKKKADVIVKGEVVSAEQRDINISAEDDGKSSPSYDSCWVSSVRVDKVIKGDLSEGDVIDVKQLIGGDPIGMGFNGSRGVMFLSLYSNGVPASPINPYQGVVPFVDGIARPSFADHAMPRGLKEDAFIAFVEAAN